EPSDLGFGSEQSWDVKALGFDTAGTLGEAADRAVRLVERQKIKETLAANENKTAAAEALGVSYKTLLAKIKEYNL
ncbi:MAG TPA: helix-turn-helix domain-containing protein, partial [Pyrinomonadaceae bacterium]|nr:helix-turn-helix domain-containing protein [Pyrinomonadaceae bacterium]